MIQRWSNTSVAVPMTTTPAATSRADTSLTGFGKPKSSTARRYALRDLAQLARLHLVDEAPHPVLAGQERAVLDARDRLADVVVEVVERLEREVWPDAGVVGDLRLHVIVAEGEHAAVGVVDEDDLLGAEQPLRDRQRPDGV